MSVYLIKDKAGNIINRINATHEFMQTSGHDDYEPESIEQTHETATLSNQ